jgi:adenosine deaminase
LRAGCGRPRGGKKGAAPKEATLDFIRALPKAELHVHLEGTLEPELIAGLAARNGLPLPASATAPARRACDYDDLQDFLELYYDGVAVLRTRRDFEDLTWAYLQRARADGVRHVELFFDPQSHTSRGVALGEVVQGIRDALVRGEAELGVTWRLIMCFLRDQGPAAALATLEAARPWRHVLAGVGLDSAESGYPPARFAAVFAAAARMGLLPFAHAGEEGPAEYVREALDELSVRRVDHGVAAADDPDLVERLVREQVPLTMCPLSNVELKVVPELAAHPLKRLLEAGVRVTINSDDPAYFCGYLADNYEAARQALGLSDEQLVQLARNSIDASLLDRQRVAELLDEVDRVWARHRGAAAGA